MARLQAYGEGQTVKAEWRPIQAAPGYEVSSSGAVRNSSTKKVLTDNPRGSYLRVQICKKHFAVHRLVAIAFIPNPRGLPEVDHVNRDKTDNSAANLRWVDHAVNMSELRRLSRQGVFGKKPRKRWAWRSRGKETQCLTKQ